MIADKIQNIIANAKENIFLTSTKNGEKQQLSFNFFQTLNRIDHYVNNQYLQGEQPIFWQLSVPRVIHTAKNIDLDTKDLYPYADGEVSYLQTWILRMKFYRWMEDSHMALMLNSRSVGISMYGSFVWKLKKTGIKTELEEASLYNLYFDQTAKSIRDVDVVQVHQMTADELREKGVVWKDVNVVLEKCKDDLIEVNEFWGYDEGRYQQVFGYGEGKDFIELYRVDKKEEDNPFYDYHLGEYQGRWLRVGVVERLFDLQVRVNQLVNQNAKASEIASLLLLRTANGELEGNVLQDVENGEIINSEDLQQIGLTNTGLQSFIAELREIENKADQLCLTPGVITGEQAPSSTPFRSLATMTNAAKSAFRMTKENIGEATGYLLKEKLFPNIVKEWNKGEIFELARDESDLKYFEKQLKQLMRWKTFVENLLAGKAIDNEQLDQVDKYISENFEEIPKKIEIPENFFNFKFHIKTNITGESMDKAQRNDALFNVLTWIQSNPQIVNIPYFRQYCEENGVDYWRLTPEQMREVQQSMKNESQPITNEATKDKLLSAVDTQ